MKPLQILSLLIIGTIILLLLYFIWWVKTLSAPTPGKSCHNTGWSWNNSCLYFDEKEYDPTLTSPAELQPYLIDFSNSPSAGNPLYLPMWYRFRYVNVITGGYSDFSKWSASPVISGGCCLPCKDGVGKCSFTQGPSTCSYNSPVIGIAQSDSAYNPQSMQSDGSFIYINVHRYVGKLYTETSPPADNVEDEIVGYMIPSAAYGSSYYILKDILYNPCNSGNQYSVGTCSKPTWCSGSEGTCTTNSCSGLS
jgi:hypothetical protein